MRFDLHLHSCLSPCASLDMAPSAIAAKAHEAGLDGIALSDHNSARNTPAFEVCCQREGVAALYSLEVCSAEEVHLLTVFDTVKQALDMTDWVYDALIKRVNQPEVFGDQEGDVLLVGWGSTYGQIREATKLLRAQGRKVGHLQIRNISPLPQGLDRIFAKYRKVDVVEINDEGLYGYGQLASLLRSALAIPTIRSICKTDGLTFKVQEILAGVSRLDASAKR